MEAYEASAFYSLTEAVVRNGLENRVEIHRGDIVEALPALLAERPGLRVSLLHCDLDVHDETLATLQTVWPRIVRGGIAVFDEYAVDNWGESDAVDAFFATLDNSPELQMLPGSPTPTAYCVKGSLGAA